jgi:hypothetical protein
MPVKSLESLRQSLARADALLPLALVGIVSGVFSALVIIAFRLLAESSFLTFGVRTTTENFEALTWPWRIGLPVVGGLAIGVMMTSVSAGTREVGVVHVMERLAYHAGRLPWRNAVMQFAGATLAIVTGHSVGREGPAIHVGAIMSRRFAMAPWGENLAGIKRIFEGAPEWLVVAEDGRTAPAVNEAHVERVITGSSRRDAGNILGILTRAQIDAAVRYGG